MDIYVISKDAYARLEYGHPILTVDNPEYYIADYVLSNGTRPEYFPGHQGSHLMNYLNENGFRKMNGAEVAKYLLL